MQKPLLFLLSVFLLYPSQTVAQSEDQEALAAFKAYVSHHLTSYQQNRRQRVMMYSQGWVSEYFEPDPASASIDVEKTNSLVSPYTGSLDFRLIRHRTAFHASRQDAASDSNFVQQDSWVHKHTYAHQEKQWVPNTRESKPEKFTTAEWSRCDEGKNAQFDLRGCLEEYDDVPAPAPRDSDYK